MCTCEEESMWLCYVGIQIVTTAEDLLESNSIYRL